MYTVPFDFLTVPTKESCTTYTSGLTDAVDKDSIEYAYACWGIENDGATSVTAFSVAILAAISALTF